MNKLKVSVLTPTGARPEAQAICRKLFERQTILNDPRFTVDWIVVDDGLKVFDWGDRAQVIHPTPCWEWDKHNTQGRNLLAGLNVADGDYIAVFEDDDFYKPDYLLTMATTLAESNADIIGEARAFYYNVKTRRYRELSNDRHASLCQTMFTKSQKRPLVDIIRSNLTLFFDICLWEDAPHGVLFPRSTLATGIKGLPGRGGVGIGHKENTDWQLDSDLAIITERLGPDIELYKDVLCTTIP